jgi:hypothetical protein
MKTQNKEYRLYVSPVIERIELDNEISLALESTPPDGPDEGYLKAPEFLNNDPFKMNMG